MEEEDMKFYGEERSGKQYWNFGNRICALSLCGLCTKDSFIVNHDGDFIFFDLIILMKDEWDILRRQRKKLTPYFTESCHRIIRKINFKFGDTGRKNSTFVPYLFAKVCSACNFVAIGILVIDLFAVVNMGVRVVVFELLQVLEMCSRKIILEDIKDLGK